MEQSPRTPASAARAVSRVRELHRANLARARNLVDTMEPLPVIRADAETMPAGRESIRIARASVDLSVSVLTAGTDELVAHYHPSQRDRV
jgi:hypothetical protein